MVVLRDQMDWTMNRTGTIAVFSSVPMASWLSTALILTTVVIVAMSPHSSIFSVFMVLSVLMLVPTVLASYRISRHSVSQASLTAATRSWMAWKL